MLRGQPPKEDAVRRKTHKDHVPTVELEPSTQLLGPDLPTFRQWTLPTIQWWQTWRTSPQAIHFTDTDWHELTATALLYDEYWSPETTLSMRLRLAVELRARVARWGATYEDRAKLRMRTPKANENTLPTEGKVVSIDYRKKLAAS